MKWIGQHVWDFISRFRSDVYLENISDGTVANDKFLGLDANNKIVKETTSTAVSDLHGAGVDGSANQLLTDDGDGTVTSESGLKFSSNILTVDGTNDIQITSSTNGLGYTPDAISTAAGLIGFKSYDIFGTGVGGLLDQQDFSSGTVTGAGFGIKAGGGYGSNKTGGNIEIVAGRGTGNSAGGSFRFWSSEPGGSGSSYNTSAVRFMIDAKGDITSYGNFKFSVADDGVIFEGGTYDTTLKAATSPSGSAKTITLPDATGTVALTSDIPKQILKCRGEALSLFYCYKGEYWYGPNANFQLNYNNGSVPNTAITGDNLQMQVAIPLVVSISDMTVYKVSMNWRWFSKSISGSEDFEFSFHTSTPPNSSTAEQTLSSPIVVTNNNAGYTDNVQYMTTWDIAGGSGIALPAGTALNMFARVDRAGTISAITHGQIWLEYRYS